MTPSQAAKPYRILAIGECMAELAPEEGADSYHLGFAGDVFNTAWYLARLRPSDDIAFFTAIGTDSISMKMRAAIVASGIDDRHVHGIEGRSIGLYLISLENGERSFSYWRGQSAARQLAQDKPALTAAVKEADLVYFSGITLAILDPDSRATLLDVLGDARASGKQIAFDPNLRPRLWSEPSDMTETIMQGAALCDIALPSFEDEARWFGDADPQTTLARYRAAGARTVIVKNGSEPVCFEAPGEAGTVPVPTLSWVRDTTAAGDSFNAAILAGLRQKLPFETCIAQACRLSGQVVQGKGALVKVV